MTPADEQRVREIVREKLEAFFAYRTDTTDARAKKAFAEEFLPAMDAYLERRRNG